MNFQNFEQGTLYQPQKFPPSNEQSNNIQNQQLSSFIPDIEKNNLFSFNLSTSNEIDIFDLSTDIYDSPQNSIFSPESTFASDSRPNIIQSNNTGDQFRETDQETSCEAPQQETKAPNTNIFPSDTTFNYLPNSNKSSNNTDFSSLRDYDISPEGYIDHNKIPNNDDIFLFEKKNAIKTKPQASESSEEKEKSDGFDQSNFFSSDTTSNFFDVPKNPPQILSSQSAQNFYPNAVQSQNTMSISQFPIQATRPVHSMPQLGIPNANLHFTSPSSSTDLFQYNQNSGNSSLVPGTIQYPYQYQIQSQRSSTAPLPSQLSIGSQISNSNSTIPIDFSLGLSQDDSAALCTLSAHSFNMAMSNKSLIFQPMALSFEPYEYWLFQERSLSFSDLVHKFFRHNKTNFTKFMYKLYDMLRITTVFPSLRQAVGVYFINNVAISVDKYAMINMLSLNPKNVDGSLFHKQGNFPTHGFIEVTSENYSEAGFTKNPVFKSKSVRILFNKDHKFVNKVMTTAELDAIAYENKSKKTYKRK